MWNSTEGRWMQSTFNYSVHNFWGNPKDDIPVNSNIFGINFNPILFLFVPIYKLFPTPITLLIIQAFFVALSGYIIFLLSESIIWQISFSLYFGLINAVLHEFHASTLTIFFGTLLIYFSQNYNRIYFFLSLILFLLIQENTAIVAFIFCLTLVFSRKNKLNGFIGSIVTLVYFFTVIKIFIPSLSNYHGYIFESIYGNKLGNNFFSIITNSFKNPGLFLETIFNTINVKYLMKIYFPVFPFVVLSPFNFLVSLSGISQNLISSSNLLKSAAFHYESSSIPFIYYAAIMGSKKIFKIKFLSFLIIIILTLISYKKFVSNKLSPTYFFQNIYTLQDKKLDEIIKKIPINASVSTQDYISGHLSHRQELYLFPVYFDKVNYILINNNDFTWPVKYQTQQEYIKKIISNPRYKIVYKDRDFILFNRININKNNF